MQLISIYVIYILISCMFLFIIRMERLEEIWNKYEEIQDRVESIDCDPSKHDDFRNEFETKFYDLNVKMQRIMFHLYIGIWVW